MIALMVKPSWPTTFHRSVRDEAGKVVKLLRFEHGKPELLDETEYAAVKADVGLALVHADVDAEGLPTGKVAREQVPAEAKSRKKK